MYSLHLPLLESLLNLLSSADTAVELLHGDRGDQVTEIHIVDGNSVTSRHDVVVVDIFDERLDTGTLQDLLFAHGLGDGKRGLVDTSDQTVTELTVLGTLIKSLDDDSLATGVTTLKDDNNFSSFDAKV